MARKKEISGKKSIVFRIALLAFAVYMIYSMITLQAQLADSKKQLSDSLQKISAKQISNKELEALLKSGSKNELIERAARDKLDFVYANEQVYEDISGK